MRNNVRAAAGTSKAFANYAEFVGDSVYSARDGITSLEELDLTTGILRKERRMLI